MPNDFRCFYVEKDDTGCVSGRITRRPMEELPAGDVLIRVSFSSVNYKDALAASGNPGVVRRLPHVPGIDAAGVVESSASPRFSPGQAVIVTGYELGSGCWGGWSEYIRVPADWVVVPPAGLSLPEAMMLGTAGFTAAQCVQSLQHHGVTPDSGEVVVTGATGGVGILAVSILSQLGYTVVAATGKARAADQLVACGASRVIGRDQVDNASPKPLLNTRWAGGVDTVGGNTLATLLRETKHRGCIAACGMVGGTDLHLTVYPFILRGVKLDGIDSAQCPCDQRTQIWQQLAGPWKPKNLSQVSTTIPLDQVSDAVAKILCGDITGRTLVEIG